MFRLTTFRFLAHILALTAFGLLTITSPALANGFDAYLVYTVKDKSLKKTVESKLASRVSMKGYNADMLAMADYSGKQKAAGKLSKARVVIIIGDNARDLLKDFKLQRVMYISNASLEQDLEQVLESLSQ